MGEHYNLVAVDFNPFEGPEIALTAPSTLSQQEIWTSCQFGGDDASRSYNESVTLSLSGTLDREAFEKAFKNLLARHECMRMAFSADGRQLCVYTESLCNLQLTDLSAMPPAQQQEHIRGHLVAEAHKTFHLLNGPLFRAALFTCGPQLNHFVLTGHHIVCDGWTLGVLLQDLGKLYSAFAQKTIPMLPPAGRYSDYAVEEWKFFSTAEYRHAEQFWIHQYREPVAFTLPTDLDRPKVRTYKSCRDDFDLDPSVVAALRKLSSQSGCSFVALMIAAFEVFLNRVTGQKDIVVGLPAAGQPATGNFGLAGHCVNLLPLKSSIETSETFSAYLKSRKTYLLDAFENQAITFGALLGKLNIPRDISRIPLVPAVLNIDIGLDDGVGFEALQHSLSYNPRAFEAFELFLNISGKNDQLKLECSYNTALFSAQNIALLMEALQSVLKSIAEEPLTPIRNIQCDYQDPIKARLAVLNDTGADFPQMPLQHLLSQTAKQFAGKTAVSFGKNSMSYAALERRSNQFAHALIALGVQPGDRIGISAERSPEMLLAIIAVLKCGGCYIPLDPAFPADRLQYMLNDSGARLLIINRQLAGRFSTTTQKLIIEDAEIQNFPDSMPDVAVDNQSDAYILYTSGSTGKPKGVSIRHSNLVNFLCSMQKKPGISSNDRLLAITTISFDIAGLELFLPLLSGAELIIADSESAKDGRLLKQLLNTGITILQATPSTWNMLIDSGWNGSKSLKALCGGEALNQKLAGQLLSTCGSVWNLYGPTETTIWSTLKEITSAEETISIGKPIDNTQVYILNENLELATEGATGEICIGGAGVAAGYLNREELSKEKFIADRFSGVPGAMLYRTGDLGKLTSAGELICLGRMDHQVKIRGHRIELDEIQFHLLSLPGIKNAEVMARQSTTGAQYLCAYIVPATTGASLEAQWKQALAKTLPDYMVPAHMVLLDSLPLTPNGKVDRKALPEPVHATVDDTAHEAPGTELEKTIAAIWSECLGIPGISINDNFFELGGHSIIAVQVMNRIEQATGINLPLASLFANSTIKGLAKMFGDSQEEIRAAYHSLVPIKPQGNKPPLFIVHGGGLNVLMFNFIAGKMDPEQPVYGLQPKGLDGVETPLDKIEDIAAHYVNAIVVKNPDGPCLLAGYSMGGMIALEMAKQLEAQGREVKLLAMLDTYAEVSERHKPLWKKASKKAVMFFPKTAFFVSTFFRYPAHAFKYRKDIIGIWFRKTFKFGRQVQLNKKVNDAFVKAFHHYDMTPYDGEIHIFKARIANYYRPDFAYLGWKPFAKKGIKIHLVNGDHRSMLLPPLDEEFAAVLQAAIDEACRQPPASSAGQVSFSTTAELAS